MSRADYTAAQLAYRSTATPSANKPTRLYRTRLAKGAPWSAIKVWWGFPVDPETGEILLERSPCWRAILNGDHVPIEDVSIEIDGLTQEPMLRAELIDETEYDYLLATNLWAKTHAPNAPEANPRQRVDLTKLPPLF